ncbi:vicilin-like seed storage protein At2g18540 [Rhopalosiphum maidis]|uniref:vicilin-like seed storage protein At2g18540 n=1 Tax=Rhopalosiphum maidis TaxID=43146 RepID=UPI000F00764E|nr:vicilin-like seed storage protein At2g18540 [Rhopalosiphum maidis]
MKLYTINPLYTFLYLVIVFAVYVSSIELFVLDGKQYLNYKYEIIFGGPQVLMQIDGATFGGVKKVRTLTPDEILELREKKNKQKEIEKKQEEEEKEKKKLQEEERKRKSQTRQTEIEMGKKQRNEEQQIQTTFFNLPIVNTSLNLEITLLILSIKSLGSMIDYNIANLSTSKEILELKERRNKQKEIEKKQEKEEKRREQEEKKRERRQEKKEKERERKQEEKEKERERKQEEKERQRERKQEEEERQRERKQEEEERQRERKQEKEERRRERKMGEARGIKGSRPDTKIRRTLSNTLFGRLPRRKNV